MRPGVASNGVADFTQCAGYSGSSLPVVGGFWSLENFRTLSPLASKISSVIGEDGSCLQVVIEDGTGCGIIAVRDLRRIRRGLIAARPRTRGDFGLVEMHVFGRENWRSLSRSEAMSSSTQNDRPWVAITTIVAMHIDVAY